MDLAGSNQPLSLLVRSQETKGTKLPIVILIIVFLTAVAFGLLRKKGSEVNNAISTGKKEIAVVSTSGGGSAPEPELEPAWIPPSAKVEGINNALGFTSPPHGAKATVVLSGSENLAGVSDVKSTIRESFESGAREFIIDQDLIDVDGRSISVSPDVTSWGIYSLVVSMNLIDNQGVDHPFTCKIGSSQEYIGEALRSLVLGKRNGFGTAGDVELNNDGLKLGGVTERCSFWLNSNLRVTRSYSVAYRIRVEKVEAVNWENFCLDLIQPDGLTVSLRADNSTQLGRYDEEAHHLRLNLLPKLLEATTIRISSDGKGELTVEFLDEKLSVSVKNLPLRKWQGMMGVSLSHAQCTLVGFGIGTFENCIVKPARQLSLYENRERLARFVGTEMH